MEESVDQAPEDIEREKQRGIARFGKTFEAGDTIAVIALQQITIQLQGSLLEQLRNAAFDDGFTDFRYLVDVADAGRDKTMNTLIELRQRLFTAETINPGLSPTTTLETVPSISSGRTRTSLPVPPSPRITHKNTPPTWAQSNHAISRDASGEEDAGSGAENIPRRAKRGSSLLGFLRHNRSNSHGDRSGIQTPTILQEEQMQESPRPSSPPHAPLAKVNSSSDRGSSISAGSVHSAVPSTNWDYQPWEDDPAKIWGTKAASESPEMKTVERQLGSPSAMPRPSVAPTWLRNSSVAIPTPMPENNFLGFCKNAVRLQNGDKGALDKHTEHAYSRSGYASATVHYLACKSGKCSFMGQLKADKIWDRVWKDEALGVKWRWAFLAKSHVQQKQSKGQQYSYQCLICTFSTGKSAGYHGVRLYIEHVASHRGDIGEVLKYKAGCVNDHVCEDDEKFDINLYPVEASESRDRKDSQLLSDDLMGLGLIPPKPEATDSIFSANEPWNEGLSNFHYGGDIDPTELE